MTPLLKANLCLNLLVLLSVLVTHVIAVAKCLTKSPREGEFICSCCENRVHHGKEEMVAQVKQMIILFLWSKNRKRC